MAPKSSVVKTQKQEDLQAIKKAENALVKYGIPRSDPNFRNAAVFVLKIARKYSSAGRKLGAENILETVSKNRNPTHVDAVANRLAEKRKILNIVESVPKKTDENWKTMKQKFYNVMKQSYYETLRKPKNKEILKQEVKRLERVYGITKDFHYSNDPEAKMILEKIR